MKIKTGFTPIPGVLPIIWSILVLYIIGINGVIPEQHESSGLVWPWLHGDGTSYKDIASKRVNYKSTISFIYHFLAAKGCTYVMGFVKNTYSTVNHGQDESRLHPLVCDNWTAWVKAQCHFHSVPREMCCGIMYCGEAISLAALDTSNSTLQQCNISVGDILIGKRDIDAHSFAPDGHLTCDNVERPVDAVEDTLNVKRSVSVVSSRTAAERAMRHSGNINTQSEDAPNQNQPLFPLLQDKTTDVIETPIDRDELYLRLLYNRNESELINETDSSVRPSANAYHGDILTPRPSQFIVYSTSENSSSLWRITEAFLKKSSKHWCKRLAKEVANVYRTDHTTYFRRSQYWVVDTYKMAGILRLPAFVTNSLMGCGVNYVMKAFHVSQWEQFLYRIADNSFTDEYS